MRRSVIGLWLILIVLAAGYTSVRCFDGLPLETDILSLLPNQADHGWEADIQRHMAGEISRRVVFLATHPERTVAQKASARISDALRNAGLAVPDAGDSETAKRLAAILLPYRTALLSQDDRALLSAGDGALVAERALGQAMSPFGLSDSGSIARDPFLLFPRYLNDLQDVLSGSEAPKADPNGPASVLSTMTLSGSAFDPAFQAAFVTTVEAEIDALREDEPALGIDKTGAVFYARRGLAEGRREASVIGAVSLVGVVLLQFLVFRGASVLVLSLVAVGAGLLCGAAATLFAFEKVHVMTAAFGGSLIGLSVDYAFHYACQRFAAGVSSPRERLDRIRTALSLGFASSLIGFLILALAPFPALRQIAVFAAGGLTASYLTVVAVFPLFDRGTKRDMRRTVAAWTRAVPAFWWRNRWRGMRFGLCGLGFAAALFGVTRLEFQDDIRRFQSLPPDLKAEEQHIRAWTGVDDVARAFVITGNDEEEVLQIEEELTVHLNAFVRDGVISGYRSVSRFVPSVRRQDENRALVQNALIVPLLDRQRAALGAPREAGYADVPQEPLRLESLRESGSAPWLDWLDFGTEGGDRIHLVTLSGIENAESLEALSQRVRGVHFVDRVRTMNDGFRSNRIQAASLLVTAIAVIAFFLALRYGAQRAVRVILPPAMATVLTLPVAAAIGEPITFFNVMGLILVFAIGLDFSLFCHELGRHDPEPTILANSLSAISTILAFGLLGFSGMLPLHAFGVTVFIGIVLAWLFAPLSMTTESRQAIFQRAADADA